MTTAIAPNRPSTAQRKRSLAQLTNTAWAIAYSAFWNAAEFSTYEKMQALAAIRNFLQQYPQRQEAYYEFVQRVLLARKYLRNHPGKKMPLPARWLDPANPLGFAGTASWFERLQHTQQSLPAHRRELRLFATALLETGENASPQVFHHWRTYFAANDEQALLNLFLCSLTNFSYGV